MRPRIVVRCDYGLFWTARMFLFGSSSFLYNRAGGRSEKLREDSVIQDYLIKQVSYSYRALEHKKLFFIRPDG